MDIIIINVTGIVSLVTTMWHYGIAQLTCIVGYNWL